MQLYILGFCFEGNCLFLFQVSWIRLSDVSLLAVGGYTYTSDLRLESDHDPGSADWFLVIRNVSESDAGDYECQVSTTPHMSSIISLQVEGERLELYQCLMHRHISAWRVFGIIFSCFGG